MSSTYQITKIKNKYFNLYDVRYTKIQIASLDSKIGE